jgi:hypothetical protein
MNAEASRVPRGRQHFEQLGAVLVDVTEYVAATVSVLESLNGLRMTQRAALLAPAFALAERHLLGALERYLDDAPSAVVDTYVPYRLALPLVIAPDTRGPREALDAPSLTRWLLALHRPLQLLCEELSAEMPEASAREALRGLATQMDAHGRALSKTFLRVEDL